MTSLDIIYTKIYENAKPRTKFQYFRNLKNTKTNFIFIGSSRVENSISPSVIERITHKKTINLGFQAAKLKDIYTLLQLIKFYNIKYEKIFIQVDYIYTIDGNSNILHYEMVPFLRENDIISQHLKSDDTANSFKYTFPFYRYNVNDLKLGFREISLNLAHKKTVVFSDNGYVGLYGTSVNHNYSLPSEIKKTNAYFIKIDDFCKINNINVVYYCAPFCNHCKNLGYVKKLKLKIPNLKDFSTAIKQEDMYENPPHLNDKGARKFTEIFAKELLINKK